MTGKHLYREVADTIITLVDNGTYRVGEKVPSIRELSRQAQVSVNTVKIAYSYLEDRSIIEARPQSGYYVCPRHLNPPSEPKPQPEMSSPLSISKSNLVVQVMRDVLDEDKIQFGAAIPAPDLIPHKKLSRIIGSETRRRGSEATSYMMPPGNKRLRALIAKRMVKAGCTIHPDEIIITSGASEAVFLGLQAVCQPGDTIAVGSPIYFNFVQMFNLLGVKVIEIPTSPTHGLHLESLRVVLAKNSIACCLVVTNFDNPLGSCMSDERKRELVQLLSEAGVPLIEDDINGDLSFSDDRPTVAKSWDRCDNVLLCSSFSKTLAPGFRLGYIAPGRFHEKVLHRKIVSNIATASPSQLAIAEFLENGGYEHHLRSIRKAYGKKVTQASAAIVENFPSSTRLTSPNGGFTLWVELAPEVDCLRLYTEAVKEKITIAPGSLFSLTGNFSHCFRLNCAFWAEETRWAIETLGQIVFQLMEEQK